MTIPCAARRLLLFSLFIAFPLVCAAQYGAMSSQELKERAEAGDIEAQFRLGSRYDSGDRVPSDGAEALKWYLRAAKAGHANAQNSMGSALQAEKRYEEAFPWYEQAAAQGLPIAIHNLGALYNGGYGVTKNLDRAFELYKRAADLGWAESMWNIANMYGAGQFGEKDLDLSCVWTFRALKYVEPNWRQRLAPASRAAGFFERTFSQTQIATCKQKADDWRPTGISSKNDAQQGAAEGAPRSACA